MKWSGKIGFCKTQEDEPSVYTEHITEHRYYGDVTDLGRQVQSGDGVNDDVTLQNGLSVICDPFAMDHLYAMRYATFMGKKWKVTNVKVQYPRLLLTLGGLWNGSDPD